MQELRRQDLYKLPGVAETLDWVGALVALGAERLDEDLVVDTLGALLKYQDDVQKVRGGGVGPLVELSRGDMGIDPAIRQ